MTEALWRDAYLRETQATVTGLTAEGGVILDRTCFYPAGGGQPGDTGRMDWAVGGSAVADTVKGAEGVVHLLPTDAPRPEPGTTVTLALDWQRRYRHMRTHTALHLLSVVIPLPVTGGQISTAKGRLDFDMPEAPGDRAALEARLNELVAAAHPVREEWITDEELVANPDLVKTMAVMPPMGTGRVRLIRIGSGAATVDLQPCGGTHVRSTEEIGPVTLGKIEKKGRQNRRVSILLD